MTAARRSLHAICATIGGMTVQEMQERMSFGEYLGWCAYLNEVNAPASGRGENMLAMEPRDMAAALTGG